MIPDQDCSVHNTQWNWDWGRLFDMASLEEVIVDVDAVVVAAAAVAVDAVVAAAAVAVDAVVVAAADVAADG